MEPREAQTRMQTVLEALDAEFRNIRTGRANPGLVEDLPVETYGTTMPMKQLATITVPEASQILITPWDKGQLVQIEAAIRDSELGVNPVNDGAGIRVSLPQMTSERREQLVKLTNSIAEEARVELRKIRHEVIEGVKKESARGKATEDDKFAIAKAMDEMVARTNAEIEARVKQKVADLAQA